MGKIVKSIAELIGNTPLMELSNYNRDQQIKAVVLAKLELFNPAGSVKDRVAKSMIEDAERKGLLKPGSVIVEPTSGNTGIGLASVGRSRGYRVILTMPDTMSVERRNLLKAYGAEIVLTKGEKGMLGAVEKAEQIVAGTPNSFMPGQFSNPANPEIHELTTGPEIWSDTNGHVDFFVAGVGTGGTLSGTGKYLKSKNPDVKVVAIEPDESPLLSEGRAGSHDLQGIGANFIPDTLDTTIYDEIIRVNTQQAFQTGRLLARTEGLLAGISAAAALYGATQIAKRPENKDKTIVVLLPDTGERYLSTPMFYE